MSNCVHKWCKAPGSSGYRCEHCGTLGYGTGYSRSRYIKAYMCAGKLCSRDATERKWVGTTERRFCEDHK